MKSSASPAPAAKSLSSLSRRTTQNSANPTSPAPASILVGNPKSLSLPASKKRSLISGRRFEMSFYGLSSKQLDSFAFPRQLFQRLQHEPVSLRDSYHSVATS